MSANMQDNPQVRPWLGLGHPNVPVRMDWPRLRFPENTRELWDGQMEDGLLTPEDMTEDGAMRWALRNELPFLHTGAALEHMPGEYMHLCITNGVDPTLKEGEAPAGA